MKVDDNKSANNKLKKCIKDNLKFDFFELKRQCPHCQKKFWHFEKVERVLFCPYCHKSIIIKPRVIKPLLKPKAITIIILFILVIGVSLPIIVPDNMKEMVNILMTEGILILVAVTLIVFGIYFLTKNQKENRLLKGVDDIQTIEQEKADYHPALQQKPYVYCPECHSYRLVELYWYRRYLAEHWVEDDKTHHNLANLPKIFTDDAKNFVGCLHCQQTFKIKMATKKEWIETLLLLGFVIVLTFVSPIISDYLDTLGIQSNIFLTCLVSFIYFYLSFSTKAKHDCLEKISFS